MNHELEFIHNFVSPGSRRRCLALIESAEGRKKFVAGLNHFKGLNGKWAKLVPPSLQTAEHIEAILKTRGAPILCHVISSNSDLDDREMPLGETLQEVVGQGFGTVVSCVPGKLAYFEGEEQNERYILERS